MEATITALELKSALSGSGARDAVVTNCARELIGEAAELFEHLELTHRVEQR